MKKLRRDFILGRRKFLHLAAGASALPIVSRFAHGQTYPSRPVRIFVGFAAGGTSDIITRLIGHWLSERLGQQFVIENRPGNSANLAAETVVRAPADGYTVLSFGTTNAINVTLLEKTGVNLTRDIAMVAGLIRSPLVLEVHPSVPAETIPEFIAYAKANPGKISMASFGTGSTSHVAGELFKMMAGVDLAHVPYRGSGPMLTDLLSGRVQMTFDNLPASIEHIRAGNLRALAVASLMRSDVLPNVPTIADYFPGYEASAWNGIGVPKNTPSAIVDKLNKEINVGLADPKIKARIGELGAATFPGSSTDFEKFVVEEVEKWGKVVKFANMKPE